ncbi:hypothetical protein [Streptomyces sp. NPDC059909]|uniref:hypothetical protein n=1 Tax=Streptomyces sp. NPDC059909 TaxID=3346998 RepID=UPI0036603BDC
MSRWGGAVDVVVVLSVLVALAAGRRVPATPAGATAHGRRIGPGGALGAVVALVCLNQALFTIHVARVHGGDASFIARYLPDGWFALAATDSGPLGWGAAHFPAPELLAPSVLRVQAFLELPFVLLAFMVVLRWLDTALYPRVARSSLLWAASGSYTAVFCLVEWDLRNPYTVDDIAVRLVAAVMTPLFIRWLAARQNEDQDEDKDEDKDEEKAGGGPLGAGGLLLFFVSLAALGALVLLVYDTLLLYNLGKVDRNAPYAAGALLVLFLARRAAGRLRGRPVPGGAVAVVGEGLRRWLVLFFVPALPVRYGVAFGTPALAALAGLLILLVAAAYALRKGGSGSRPRLGAQLGAAAVVGTAAAYAAGSWGSGTYYEVALLSAVTAFLLTGLAVCAATDALVR